MDRIIDISSDNRHLKKKRGFLVVMDHQTEMGRVPLDQVLAVMVHGHGITYSNNLLVALAQQGSLVVLCAANHAPQAVMMPLENHSLQGARIRDQWQARPPLLKRLWQQIVCAKVLAQADCLKAFGISEVPVRALASKIRTGDGGNIEAQAARRYWPLLMGKEFRRDLKASGHNGQLNYGYTILRSMVMRSVVASGLTPTIGLFHSNRGNAFALADDLMEPFRPIVDATVYGFVQSGIEEVTSDIKLCLARLVSLDVQLGEITCPLSQAASQLCLSLVRSFETNQADLAFPLFPSALEVRSLGQGLAKTG